MHTPRRTLFAWLPAAYLCTLQLHTNTQQLPVSEPLLVRVLRTLTVAHGARIT